MTVIERLSREFKKNNNKLSLALGEFLIKKPPLGQGGNGIVYEATINDKVVALKFLLTNSNYNPNNKKIKRFISEYLNIAELNNAQSIVRYIDYDLYKIQDEIGELIIPIIIMTKYESSLAQIQKDKSEDKFISLYSFLVDTVNFIHQEGIIHRDIKPENILILNNSFYLADFGIASYNPNMFQVLANTEKKERLGNRLFSAPEQEIAGIEASPTMDIYAIGQVLQWYATSFTHRGTGRQKITTVFKSLHLYDEIIEKCLQQNPTDRFQSISDIQQYIKRLQKKNVFEYLYLFHDICTSSFPRNEVGIIHSNNLNKINYFLITLTEKQYQFDNTLWWVDGIGSFDFQLKKVSNSIWKFDNNEYHITDIWVYYDNSCFNDFVLIHFKKGKPFIFENKERYFTAIVDNKHHISYSEYTNGYAEIEGKIVDLSKHTVEFIERQDKNGYFFIGTSSSCIIQPENDEEIRNIIDKLMHEKKKPTTDELKTFEKKIRKNKHVDVLRQL